MTDNQRAMTIPDDIYARASKVFPFTHVRLCGEWEDLKKGYFMEIYTDINPRDFLEEEWVQDVFDYTWNCRRLRNLKVALLNASASCGLEKILTPLIGLADAVALAHDWHVRDEAAIKRVDEILTSADLSMDAAMAETLALRLPEIERIDRMIADGLAGRASIFREIERYRSALARKLRQAVDQIEDAEFKEVADGSSSTKLA
jgi:hypothetical protein